MRKGIKARPHDIDEVMALGPEILEIHASSEDMVERIDGKYAVPLVVHLPEYNGTELMDPASPDEAKRLAAERFYEGCLSTVREWGTKFRGTPKTIIHPGGWSSNPMKSWETKGLYESFFKTVTNINKTGVDFLVENMPPQPWFYGGQWHCNIFMDPRDCRDFCAGNGVGFCFDICHAFLWCNFTEGSYDLFNFMQIVRPVTSHIHISDGRGVDGEGMQIGEGEMPIARILDQIRHWNVGAVCEIWQGHKDGMAGFKTAWQRIDTMIGSEKTAQEVSHG